MLRSSKCFPSGVSLTLCSPPHPLNTASDYSWPTFHVGHLAVYQLFYPWRTDLFSFLLGIYLICYFYDYSVTCDLVPNEKYISLYAVASDIISMPKLKILSLCNVLIKKNKEERNGIWQRYPCRHPGTTAWHNFQLNNQKLLQITRNRNQRNLFHLTVIDWNYNLNELEMLQIISFQDST